MNSKTVAFLAALAVLPLSAFAQVHDGPSEIDDYGLIPNDGTVGPVALVDELARAHGDISGIMAAHSEGDFAVADDLVLTLAFVDPDAEELVVGFDPVLLTLGIYPDEGDIEDILGEDLPARAVFSEFIPEGHIRPSSQSQISTWMGLYNDRCSSPADGGLCDALSFNLRQNHYFLDNNNRWQPPGGQPDDHVEPGTTPAATSTVVFSDDFEGGLGKWTESDEPDWRADRFDERKIPPNHDSDNRVAEADNCDTKCTLTVSSAVDISSLSGPTLEFWRYLDRSIDDYDGGDGEYLKLEVSKDGGTWTQLDIWTEENGDDDDRWHEESYDLTPYKSSGFKLRFVASMSSSNEEAGIDDVRISGQGAGQQAPRDSDGDGIPDSSDDCPNSAGLAALGGCPDTEAPVIHTPGDITATIRAGSLKYVEFSVTATDNVDQLVVPGCSHDTGFFRIGETPVTCTAVDDAGNRASASFTVTVNDRAAPNPDTDGDGLHDGIDQCPTEYSTTNFGCPEPAEPACPAGGAGGQGGGDCPDAGITTKTFYGGQKHKMNLINSTDVFSKVGTVTTGAVSSTGQHGFVVSAHVLAYKPGDIFVNHTMSVNNFNTTFSTLVANHQNRGNVDAAFIPINKPNIIASTTQIYALNGTLIDFTQGTLEDVPRLKPVNIYGMTNNSQGLLLFKNATIHDIPHNIFTNMGLATYNSTSGDSGAPIVHHSQSGTKLIGSHRGGVCIFDAASENQPLVNVTGSSILCTKDSFYYKSFNAWENVKKALSLQ